MTSLQNNSLLQTRKQIFEWLEQKKISVSSAASLLGISRQALWYRRRLIRRYGPIAIMPMKPGIRSYQRAWNRTGRAVENRVVKLRFETQGGPTTISWMLEEEGIRVHRQTVYRILVRKGIIYPKQKGKVIYQRYTLGYPGAEVQFDFTQIEDSKERFWLASAVDDHTRWGFCRVYDRPTSHNALDFLHHIIETAPFPVVAIRTDQGSEVSKQFTKKCKKQSIIHIRNRIKTPRHNGKVERFHRTVQEECLWYKWHWCLTPIEAQYRLNLFLGFYNHRRHHQGLGMEGRSPMTQLQRFIYHAQQTDNVKRIVLPYKS